MPYATKDYAMYMLYSNQYIECEIEKPRSSG